MSRQRDVINLAPIIQHTQSDCALAAVAMLIGRSYAEVYHANEISQVVAESGATDAQIRILAESFGAKVKKVRAYNVDLEGGTGLLSLKGRDMDDWHLVVMFRGVLIDPGTGLLWAPEFFFQENPHLTVEYLLELM